MSQNVSDRVSPLKQTEIRKRKHPHIEIQVKCNIDSGFLIKRDLIRGDSDRPEKMKILKHNLLS